MMDPQELKKKLKKKEPHVCIRIFKDDQVAITDPAGKQLKPSSKPVSIVGPTNTYDQAVWFNKNPTCVYHRGIPYCG